LKREKRETLKEGRKGKAGGEGVGYGERSQLHRGEDARQVEEEAHAPSEAEAPQDEAALQVGAQFGCNQVGCAKGEEGQGGRPLGGT